MPKKKLTQALENFRIRRGAMRHIGQQRVILLDLVCEEAPTCTLLVEKDGAVRQLEIPSNLPLPRIVATIEEELNEILK